MYNRTLIFIGACIGLLFFGVCLITLGSVVYDLKQKYQMDDLAAGALFSILPLGILAGSLLFGPVCDRYGYKLLLSSACVSMFLGFEGIAFAPSHGVLQLSIFLVGLGGGAINGGTNAMVSDISVKGRGADLSLLGVSFGIGALGMPFLLGLLQHRFAFESIISATGFATLAVGIFYCLIQFPPAKQVSRTSLWKSLSLAKDPVIVLVACFLFCQSSFEAIVNNWTTTYLSSRFAITNERTLYALSSFVLGMTVMRILIGSVLRSVSPATIWILCFACLALGVLLVAGSSYSLAVAGLILMGAGLAAGFPLMLGIVGSCYPQHSGTAFSLVLGFALIGNMAVNYSMGIIANQYGIGHLITVQAAEVIVMIALCIAILYVIKRKTITE